MSYGVSTSDIEARWRPLEAEESVPAVTLISDAEDILDGELPALSGLFGQGGRLDRMVKATVCAMVIRVLRNPDAMRQQSVGEIQQTFGGPEFDGRLYLTETERDALSDALAELTPGAAPGGAFSFDPTRSKLARRAPWQTSVLRAR